jgi:uncharacterized Rossmann fold enzyme
MAKLDKSLYSKSEWQKLRDSRRAAKKALREEKFKKQSAEELKKIYDPAEQLTKKRPKIHPASKIAFVVGNGTSRAPIQLEDLATFGKIYACNAVYRTFRPDYLVAVDVKMILEIAKSGYQHHNEVWTNYNKSYQRFKNLNYFHPSKGWSSGPTALWLASEHSYEKIFILGFDYKGLDGGSKFNNMFADSPNYKKSADGATFFGNWLRQTTNVLKEHPNTQFYRVIAPDNYIPDELNKFDNIKHISVEDFQKMFNIS